MEGTLSTQRHHDRVQPRDNGPARRRAVLSTLTLWTLAVLAGCQSQQKITADSPAVPPQPAPQAQDQTPSVKPAVAAGRITSPTAGLDQNERAVAVHEPSRWLTDEVVSPAEFAARTPVKEPRLVNTPGNSTQQPPEVSPQPQAQAPSQAQPLVTVVPPQAMPSLRPGMADEMVSVNFDNVDIRTVLKTIGDITGINFIPHESVTGTVTVMSPTPIRLGDLYAFLQSILDVHGYATIEMNNAVKVVPKADAARNHLQVRIGADPAYIPRTDVIVTQILPLKHANADEIRTIIDPILSTGAQVATYPRTNSLMITDTSANLHHIAQVLQQLDVEGSRERALTLPLTHASARVLSEQITRILEKNRTAPQTGRVSVASAASDARVMPDDRTNSLIVIANEQDTQTIRGLVEQLDIPRPAGMNNVHVVYLKNADANEVGRSLEQAMASLKLTGAVEGAQQVQITPDPSTNALVVVASPQDFEVVEQIIQKLDIVREQVLVEMLITEITEESLREIGVDWATLDNAVADSVRGFGTTNLGPRVDFMSGASKGLNVGAWKATGGGTQIGAILHAVENQSGVNILSTPSILTSNHRKAKIVVGENRPFVTDSRITESTDADSATVIKSYDYKDVGITLEITPHISQGGLIRLDVKSEFTKLTEDVTTLSEDTPITAKRSADTVVTMSSGATIVIGGLIRDDVTRGVTKIPLVGDLPLIGGLFRSESKLVQKTNLLLFITPHVVSTQEDLLRMTERKRQEMSSAEREN